MTTSITTHVLDVTRGTPASGVCVVLEVAADGVVWKELGRGETDANGRIQDLVAPNAARKGQYRLTFETGAYFAAQKISTFYPRVTVVFSVLNETEHFHVPLLLSPYGYSTYRGS